MSTMTLDGYTARITYDSELDQFRGEIVGLNGGADFYGKTPTELRREFRKSLKVYLEVCQEKGINPHRQFSGKFNLRISPELHQRLATLADASGESLNTLVEKALTKVMQDKVEVTNKTNLNGSKAAMKSIVAVSSGQSAVASSSNSKSVFSRFVQLKDNKFVQFKKKSSGANSAKKPAKVR